MLTVQQWEQMTPKERSKWIFELWQIPHAAETLSATWQVVSLLTSWGFSIEWMPALEEDARKKGYHYCVISGERAKIGGLKDGVGYGSSLSESLVCAALRSTGLLANH
jgi:hypothetical protein